VKVLVTGGSGFVGKRLRLIRPDWTYASSKSLDLTDHFSTMQYLRRAKPDAVVHLAGRVGGIKDNSEHPAEFFYDNIVMNTNIVECCYRSGIKRLLASISTCAFPDVVDSYPLREEDLLKGPPAPTNMSYGFTKRALSIQIQAYRKQHGLNYSCFCPSNIYGPGDHFDDDNSHFVPAAISKFHNASPGRIVEFWGTGSPLRQQLYVDDLCSIIPDLLTKHEGSLPLIVAPDYNLSVSSMVRMCRDVVGKDVSYSFNGEFGGQFRKDGSNARFKQMFPSFEFTPFEEGIRKTYEWYKESINNGN